MIVEQIKYYANLFEGIKERKGNMGWQDVFFPDLNMSFQELMHTVGWRETHAWCAYFAELVWKLAYTKFDSTMVPKLDKLFSASAVNTWANFKGTDFKRSQIPAPGSLLIFQLYENNKPTAKGHAAIVMDGSEGIVNTIEGNTNAKGTREGDQVAKKTRLISFEPKQNGLVPLGFIYPVEI